MGFLKPYVPEAREGKTAQPFEVASRLGADTDKLRKSSFQDTANQCALS